MNEQQTTKLPYTDAEIEQLRGWINNLGYGLRPDEAKKVFAYIDTLKASQQSFGEEQLYRKSVCPKCEGGRNGDPLRCTECQGHKYVYAPFDPTNHHNAAKCPYCREQRTEQASGREITDEMVQKALDAFCGVDRAKGGYHGFCCDGDTHAEMRNALEAALNG